MDADNKEKNITSVKSKLEAAKPREFVGGFRDFIKNYGIAPLAIGVVIGTAVNDFVKTLVDGLITPFISLVTPEGKLQTFKFIFHGAVFKFGAVINSLFTFLVVALFVYIVAKTILRDDALLQKK